MKNPVTNLKSNPLVWLQYLVDILRGVNVLTASRVVVDLAADLSGHTTRLRHFELVLSRYVRPTRRPMIIVLTAVVTRTRDNRARSSRSTFFI